MGDVSATLLKYFVINATERSHAATFATAATYCRLDSPRYFENRAQLSLYIVHASAGLSVRFVITGCAAGKGIQQEIEDKTCVSCAVCRFLFTYSSRRSVVDWGSPILVPIAHLSVGKKRE